MGLCPPVQTGAATLGSGQAPRGICCGSSAAAVQRWRRALGCSAPRAVPVPAQSLRAPVLTVGVGVRSLLVRHDPGRGVVHLRREGTRELSACGQGAGEAAVLARPAALGARCCCSERWRQGRGEQGQQGEALLQLHSAWCHPDTAPHRASLGLVPDAPSCGCWAQAEWCWAQPPPVPTARLLLAAEGMQEPWQLPPAPEAPAWPWMRATSSEGRARPWVVLSPAGLPLPALSTAGVPVSSSLQALPCFPCSSELSSVPRSQGAKPAPARLPEQPLGWGAAGAGGELWGAPCPPLQGSWHRHASPSSLPRTGQLPPPQAEGLGAWWAPPAPSGHSQPPARRPPALPGFA